MSLHTFPRTVKWPFLVGDAMLLGLAGFFFAQAHTPLNGATLAACVACVALGAALGITPFLADYRAAVRLAEASGLAATVEQIQGLQSIAANITQATGQWQGVNEHAHEAVHAARQVSEQMSAEMKSFLEFFAKADTSERQHLTLEVDKLKRAESEWLGVLVRILDHVFALHTAASRSGEARVIEQLSRFQLACRDVARRVGLIPFETEPGTEFDASKHQLPQEGEVAADARIAATLAPGFNFRGQMLRPALVQLEQTGSPVTTGEQDPQAGESEPSSPDHSAEQELGL